MKDLMEWVQIDTDESMPEAHYLVLKLRDLDKRVYGDFQFKCEFKNGCKFYFWLNVKALLYNEELREIT